VLNPKSKKVVQLEMDGSFVKVWDSIREAERVCGFDSSSISACCLGKYKFHRGYLWKYAES
jgi:hypothetical protein